MTRFTGITLLLIAVLCFWLAGRMQRPLLQERRDFHLSTGEPLENSPPLVAFTTVALGGFRGIIADLLWLRSSQLQQDGKYFELVQLADWITKLEPRMAQVWAFHAWNMAYNVSVLFNNPEDRWRWVRQGIVLLRDEGLRYNPGDPNLYRELGWIYQHKMSGNLDQMNIYYKKWWAEEMATLFDGPRPDYAAYVAGDPAVAERVQRMKEVYKLDPAIMQQIDAQYGPLDWRLPQPHAIYWAWRGKPYATGFASLQLERMVLQTMCDAAIEGDLFINPAENVFTLRPNAAVFAKVRSAYEKAIAENPDESTLKTAHRNFLNTAVMILYTHHHLSEARDAFADLRRLYPEPSLAQDLDTYVYRRMTDFLQDVGQREATAIVLGALQQSWYWLAMGAEDRAQGFQQLARTTWRRYMQDRTPELVERVGLSPFEQLSEQARAAVKATLTNEAAAARLGKAN